MGLEKKESVAADLQKQSNKSTHYKSKPSIAPDFFANNEKIEQLRAKISAVSSSSSLQNVKNLSA